MGASLTLSSPLYLVGGNTAFGESNSAKGCGHVTRTSLLYSILELIAGLTPAHQSLAQKSFPEDAPDKDKLVHFWKNLKTLSAAQLKEMAFNEALLSRGSPSSNKPQLMRHLVGGETKTLVA